MYSVPIKCKDYADYERAANVAKELNDINDKFPMQVVLGSGSEDPDGEGIRWADVHCASQAKIQHFLEIGLKLEKDTAVLERAAKADTPTMPNPNLPNPMGLMPMAHPGMSLPGMDIYTLGDPTDEEMELLDFLREKLREARDKYEGYNNDQGF